MTRSELAEKLKDQIEETKKYLNNRVFRDALIYFQIVFDRV